MLRKGQRVFSVPGQQLHVTPSGIASFSGLRHRGECVALSELEERSPTQDNCDGRAPLILRPSHLLRPSRPTMAAGDRLVAQLGPRSSSLQIFSAVSLSTPTSGVGQTRPRRPPPWLAYARQVLPGKRTLTDGWIVAALGHNRPPALSGRTANPVAPPQSDLAEGSSFISGTVSHHDGNGAPEEVRISEGPARLCTATRLPSYGLY